MKIKNSWLKVHRALHTIGVESVEIHGIEHPIQKGINGCRFVKFRDFDLGPVTMMEQNYYKNSSYAARARAGETLSWVMPKRGGNWTLIDIPVKQLEVA